ncbi:MAG TPA: hypothetical protein PLR99_02570, partial [Polyangiaceae bacterium]|nr:hypothetical protein [Polyangiaceae bacterium]
MVPPARLRAQRREVHHLGDTLAAHAERRGDLGLRARHAVAKPHGLRERLPRAVAEVLLQEALQIGQRLGERLPAGQAPERGADARELPRTDARELLEGARRHRRQIADAEHPPLHERLAQARRELTAKRAERPRIVREGRVEALRQRTRGARGAGTRRARRARERRVWPAERDARLERPELAEEPAIAKPTRRLPG